MGSWSWLLSPYGFGFLAFILAAIALLTLVGIMIRAAFRQWKQGRELRRAADYGE